MTYDPGPKINTADPRFTTDEHFGNDLHDQFEAILGQVRESEANERFLDRIDLATSAPAAGVALPTIHRCSPPAATDNDQAWQCPDCERSWASGLWQRTWKRDHST